MEYQMLVYFKLQRNRPNIRLGMFSTYIYQATCARFELCWAQHRIIYDHRFRGFCSLVVGRGIHLYHQLGKSHNTGIYAELLEPWTGHYELSPEGVMEWLIKHSNRASYWPLSPVPRPPRESIQAPSQSIASPGNILGNQPTATETEHTQWKETRTNNLWHFHSFQDSASELLIIRGPNCWKE